MICCKRAISFSFDNLLDSNSLIVFGRTEKVVRDFLIG